MALVDLSLDRLAGQLRWTASVQADSAAATLVVSLDQQVVVCAPLLLRPENDSNLRLCSGHIPVQAPFDNVTLCLTDNADISLSTMTIARKAIRNDQPPRAALGHAMVDCRSGAVTLSGWLAPTHSQMHAVRLRLNGADLGTVFPTIARPDVAERFPLLDTDNQGWAVETQLTPVPTFPAILTLEILEKGKGSIVQTQVMLTREQVAHTSMLLNRLVRYREAAAAGLVSVLRPVFMAGVRTALASKVFQQRWAKGSTTTAFRLRRVLVDFALKHNLIDGPIDIRLKAGHLVRCDVYHDKVIARRFLLEGGYENAFIDFLQKLVRHGDTVMDVGAAYGAVSMALADAVGAEGRVIAVEADPSKLDSLTETFARNNCSQITLVGKAVADMPGTLDFLSFSTNPGGSRLVADRRAAHVAHVMDELSSLTVCSLDAHTRGRSIANVVTDEDFVWRSVPATTLAEICQQYDLSNLMLIKLDIEGAELKALRGAATLLVANGQQRPIVVLEYSKLFAQQGGDRREIFSLLSSPSWRGFYLTGGKDREGGVEGGFCEIFSDEDCPIHENLFFVPVDHPRVGLFEPVGAIKKG